MPTVELYYRNKEHELQIANAIDPLKVFITEKLTCSDISLAPEEVSIRDIHIALSKKMITDVELDITTTPFQERINRQNKINLNVQTFTKNLIPNTNDIKIWLKLHELKHNFE